MCTSLKQLCRTFLDIGFRRLQRRLRYSLRQKLDHRLSPPCALALAGAIGPTPAWVGNWPITTISPPANRTSQAESSQSISFVFLNEKRKLFFPILWNNSAWPRLWQFNLHYFDWSRKWLDLAVTSGEWPPEAWALEPLIDQWIAANSPGRGDGWHSYTISLRTRTWVKLFSHCPALVTPSRLKSLWQQLCWLQAHPEDCHGGNHWLENLISLAIGGLQFDGLAAKAMHRRAINLLSLELVDQLLCDGGHQERSASYHLLMLDRLIELGEHMQVICDERPRWLLDSVARMTQWVIAVRLESGSFPCFNDSPTDSCRPLDSILSSARNYLRQAELPISHRARVVSASTHLSETGWTLLRPGGGWELAFKCGVPCPPHLAAHAHSDLLSFDLFHHGQPVIAEVGTSIYGSGPDRLFERSSAAHNSLQLGRVSGDSVTWIEPVDVWAGFRAGRKAQPRSRSFGHQGPWHWVAGSHNGYHSIKAQHYRWLALRLSSSHQPVLVVIDTISAAQPVHWRGWLHLGSNLSPSLSELSLQLKCWPPSDGCHSSVTEGYISAGFGRRLPRLVLNRFGSLPVGQHILISVLAPQGLVVERRVTTSNCGTLCLDSLGSIHWYWPYSIEQHFLATPNFFIQL